MQRDLERYLPGYLWQKLADAPPGRGVLLNVLEALRSTRYLISTYLPGNLVQNKLRDPVPGQVYGQKLSGNLLFADVSGFTALSERLAGTGEIAESFNDIVNRYFDAMHDILARSGGRLVKFAGDAFLAYFPAMENNEQAQWAVRAGFRMMHDMKRVGSIETPTGAVSLQIKIGISGGEFWAMSVGSPRRMEYVVLGETVARTMAAEGLAQAGELVVDSATARAIESLPRVERAPGLYVVHWPPDQDLDEFEIKAATTGRKKGATSWLASQEEILDDLQTALRQIQAIVPYLPAELVERILNSAKQRQFPSEYRRTVVLFVNVTGFETLLSALPGEKVTQLWSDYFNTVHQIVSTYGGIVSRIDPYKQGSKVLILFGAPVTHEDDEQRGFHTALALRSELAALNNCWQRDLGLDDPPVQQRIGITCGMAFAGQAGTLMRREYTVMGDDVNLAARLMSAAQPGQILACQSLADTIAGDFGTTSLPPIRVKGKALPIAICQVDGLRDDQLIRRLQSHGPLLGRDAELDQCQKILLAALGGCGTLLTLQGAAGVGKSHLANTLAGNALAEGARVLFCECSSFTREAPYSPWIALLRQAIGIAPGDQPEAALNKLRHLLQDLGLAQDDSEVHLANLLGLPVVASATLRPVQEGAAQPKAKSPADSSAKPSLFAQLGQKVADQKETRVNLWQLTQERRTTPTGQMWQRLQTRVAEREQLHLFAAVRRVIERLGRAPMLLFFENVQWMDTPSRELINYLSRRLDSQPIMVLVVQRGEDETRPAAPFEVGTTIQLKPLSLAGTLVLVASLLKGAPFQTDLHTLGQAIHEQSGGNPLYIEEMVRWLQRTAPERLKEMDSARSASEMLRGSLSLQELVMSRLDSLSHGERETIKAASVVGQEFHASDVRGVLEETASVAVGESLTGLQAARMIIQVEMLDDPRHAFQQVLIRELVYESQSFARRRELHARIAALLEMRCANDPMPYAELLAHHFGLANHWLPAARYLLLSGHKARRSYAYPQARHFFEQSLAALKRLAPEQVNAESHGIEAQANEGQGDMALASGDWAIAAGAFRAAHTLLTKPGETCAPVEARVALKLALVLPTQDQTEEAITFARRANDDDLPIEMRVAASATLAWLLWRSDDREADDWIRQTETLTASPTDPWSAGVAALMQDLSGDYASAREAYMNIGQLDGTALVLCQLGDRHLVQGSADQALKLYNQASDIWDQENDAHGLALARYRQAQVYWQQSDADLAYVTLNQALALLNIGAPADQADQRAIQSAREIVKGECAGDWPAWHWRLYDDAFRISILFRA